MPAFLFGRTLAKRNPFGLGNFDEAKSSRAQGPSAFAPTPDRVRRQAAKTWMRPWGAPGSPGSGGKHCGEATSLDRQSGRKAFGFDRRRNRILVASVIESAVFF